MFKAELDGPLKAVGDLLPHVVALNERLDATERLGIEHERGTGKGIDYEQAVGEFIVASLAPHRDTVEGVGTELGADRDSAATTWRASTPTPRRQGGRIVVEVQGTRKHRRSRRAGGA